jgi:hypothetical protein
MRKEALFKLEEQPVKIIRKLAEIDKAKAVEFAKMVAAEPLKYWCPNLVQEQMIAETVAAQQESPVSTVLFTCGNGVGKTTAVVNIICNLIYGPQNGWFDYPLFRNWPYPKHITLVTTPGNISDNYFSESSGAPSFQNFLAGRDVTYSKDGKNHISKVKFGGTPWSLRTMTYNQDKSEMESFTTGVFVFDEPPPAHFWEAVPARTRKGAIILMPMTPLDCDPYVQDEIIDKADAKVPGYRHITASATQVLDDQPRGHYPKAVFEAQRERYSDEEAEARVDGKLMYFSERIIQVDESVHRVDPEDYPLKPNYLYYHVFDPGDGKPNAELWGAITPEGRKIVFAEAPLDQTKDFWDMKGGTTVKDHIQQCLFREKGFEKRYGFKMNFTRIVDYHFANQTRGGLKTNLWADYAREAKKLGVSFHLNPSYSTTGTGETELIFGHKHLRNSLQYLPDGKPGFVFYRECYHCWRGITHYVRKRAKTEAEMMQPATTRKIVQKYKDMVDVMRYFDCHQAYFPKKRDKSSRRTTSNGVYNTI